MTYKQLQLAQKIIATKGKFFSVEFTKKDGTLRKLNGRLNVKKFLKGGQSSVRDYDNYLVAFDIQKMAYRNINLETITKFNGQKV